MDDDEDTGKRRADELRAAGIHTVEDLLFRLETLERSDMWVYVACDRLEDGSLHLVNATGFYPDEMTAALAGQMYVREWMDKLNEEDEDPPEIFAIPFFAERETAMSTSPAHDIRSAFPHHNAALAERLADAPLRDENASVDRAPPDDDELPPEVESEMP